jgi:hypothetical protein
MDAMKTSFSHARAIAFVLGALAAGNAACSSDDPNNKLMPSGLASAGPSGGSAPNPAGDGPLAAPGNAQAHVAGPDDPSVGTMSPAAGPLGPGTTPVEPARLHGCTKLTYSALGALLQSRGVSISDDGKNTPALPAAGAPSPDDAKNADPSGGGNGGAGKAKDAGSKTPGPAAIYKSGGAALGVANYGGRVPESLIASTSAMAKQFDIFVAAAPTLATMAGMAPGCMGVSITDSSGNITKNGVTCLLGKLAKDAHVTVANQAVADAVKAGATPEQGLALVIAALMEAAHTCE